MKTLVTFFLFGVVFMLPRFGQAQLLSVSGNVKNYFTGQVVENATVYETVSGIGTITNSDGYYRLLLNHGQQHLKISSTGYETFTSAFELASDTIISVDMKPENSTKNKFMAGNKMKKDSIESTEKPVTVQERN